MKIETAPNGRLTLRLTGEIDHHSAAAMRKTADAALIRFRPRELVLDFSDVSFMDSSGVGFVMGRSKHAAAFDCKTAVCGLKERDRRIMKLSGLESLVTFCTDERKETT
ncbi:MAG: anti-sigma factor antagonist [Clostridia bacterium]|nr:anti-sigma factor antagonist [Clostridia bacterium]